MTSPSPSLPQLEGRAPDYVGEMLESLMADQKIAGDVTLILCDDAFIHDLNVQHRGEDKPTDVLSYPTNQGADESVGDAFVSPFVSHLGDIFISLETAARQAADNRLSVLQEVLVLSAHGLTHLLGHDHHTEEQWQIFRHHQTRMHELHNAQSQGN